MNELLCYLLNKYGNVQIEAVKKVVLSFYNGSEISCAKELLFKTVYSELSDDLTDGLPRNVSRRKSDSRSSIELDDVVGLIDAIDEKQLLPKLPMFVASKPERLPPFRSDELDLCLAVQRISALEEKLSFVVTQCTQMAAMVSANSLGSAVNSLGAAGSGGFVWSNDGNSGPPGVTVEPQPGPSGLNIGPSTARPGGAAGPSGFNKGPSGVNMGSPAGPPHGSVGSLVGTSDVQVPSWANMAGTSSFDPVTQRRLPVAPPASRLVSAPVLRGAKPSGTGKGQTAIQGVPRRITAFVGRLHKDTTEDELRDLLVSAGIEDAKCKKLEAKNGREFATAAFCVSCSITWNSIFYQSDTWPAGAELRDWVFYDKKKPGQQ